MIIIKKYIFKKTFKLLASVTKLIYVRDIIHAIYIVSVVFSVIKRMFSSSKKKKKKKKVGIISEQTRKGNTIPRSVLAVNSSRNNYRQIYLRHHALVLPVCALIYITDATHLIR